MKKIILTLVGSIFLMTTFLTTGCAPTAKQIKEIVEKDPSIVFVAIEKNPDKFIEIVNKAARDAQMKGQAKAQEDENKKRDEEFKNPLNPEVEKDRAVLGPADAKITIVEYSDFECPYCSRGHKTIKEVIQAYPTQVRIVFKHLPLEFHAKALPAAKYFEAVAKQGSDKAYKFHDIVFENQDKLKEKGDAFLEEAAKKAGADVKKVKKDMAGSDVADRIAKDTAEAQKFGMSGTPGFIINGVTLRGAYPFSEFKAIIDRHLGTTNK